MNVRSRFPFLAMISVLLFAAVACAGAPAAQPNPTQPPAASIPETPTPAQPPETPEPGDIEMVESMAPIESVQINIAESFPPQYFVQVTSGLPSGCVTFDRYDVERDGETVNISVYNLEPASGELIACTMIYGFEDTNIALGTDFEGGVEYTVNVNDVTETFVAQGEGGPAPDVVEVPAPIESVQIDISEDASRAELIIVSGLPDSCHELEKVDVEVDGDIIIVDVINRQLVGNVMCAEIYGLLENPVELDSDIQPCDFVDVIVNGSTYQAQAIAPNVRCQGWQSHLSPVQSVEINVSNPVVPEYSATVIATLPKGSICSREEGFVVERNGSEIDVTVTHQEIIEQNLPCTADLPIVEYSIPLGGDFETGETYTVTVNGVLTETFVAAEGRSNWTSIPAPIESVEVRATDTGYTLVVVSRQPRGSSCSDFEGFEVEREGNVINVLITNLENPADNAPCTRDLPVDETIIDLGSDFADGENYTVVVNGLEEEFVAGELENGLTSAELGSEFEIPFGGVAAIESEGLELAFVSVLEDSRCPADVECIWEGQVRIKINVASVTENLGDHELYLESVREDRSIVDVGEYLVQLRALDPDPAIVGQFELNSEVYTATLVVFNKDSEY